MPASRQFLFTITPGHTGTTWLASMLQDNLPDCRAYHERLGWNCFGEHTPDVSHMTLFNSQGNIAPVRQFWERKSGHVLAEPAACYVETSHLLAKCGLMENIGLFTRHGHVTVLCLGRDPVAIVRSMRKRGDMQNKGDHWMWHLDPEYPRKLVHSGFFKPHGLDGLRLWYVCEMQTRAAYYRQLMAATENLRFVTADIEDLGQPDGAYQLLKLLHPDTAALPELPQKTNRSHASETDEDTAVRELWDGMEFDPEVMAAEYIARGYRLGMAA